MKHNLLAIILFLLGMSAVHAQVSEDFSDGDFTLNPTWSGHDSIFTVNAGELQSQRNGALDYYLSTPSSLSANAQWELYLNLTFSTSGVNYVDIYLMADVADLTAVNNGYFVRVGGTPDEVSFFEVVGGVSTMIIDGPDGITNSSNNPFNIKVTRDAADLWTLFYDDGAIGTYSTAGTVTNANVNSSAFFGMFIKQSSAASPVNGHFFDNISVGAIGVDLTPPVVDSIQVLNNTDIDVYFSEFVDVTTATNITNYFATGAQENPSTITIDAVDSSLAHLTFSTPFISAQNDTLQVQNVEDRASNVMTNQNIPFVYFFVVVPSGKDIVFNELFADPTPQIGLPDGEFVELYNASSNAYDLSGWQFVNTSTVKTLPSHVITPGAFIILCSIADTALYQPYGDVIGISSWTALSNGGDSLTLLDNSGNIIDRVSYDISWYQDAVKDDGGWSLELINPQSLCGSSASNWGASNDVIGGTPGAQNSIYSAVGDITAPDLSNLVLVNDSIITLTFSETMDSASLANGNYSITNGLVVDFVSSIASDLQSVTLELTTSIDTGVVYEVTVTGVTDCPGNTISAANVLSFVIGFPATEGDVVINEIFADPTPAVALPEKEFVEIYNTTSNLIDLSNTLFDGEPLPANSWIQPNGYVILCAVNDTDEFSGFGEVIGLSSFPSLTNGGEYVDFTTDQGVTIDEITYSSSWYGDENKDDGGWSLEKKNPIAVCNGSTNWAAANNFLGGTPGNQNSIYDNTPDQNLPTVTGVSVLSAQTVILAFSEPMDSASLTNGTYTVSGGISILSATTVGSPFDSVFLFFSAPVDTGITYTITATNVADCPGNTIGTANTIEFILAPIPTFGEVVINEIFADPSPIIGLPDQEFIELYNTTNKTINLSGSLWEDKTIPDGTYIAPNDFLIVCEDEDTSLFVGYGAVVGLSSWPSLTNSGESINLTAPNGNLIDQVTYSSAWYNDSEKDDGGWTLERVNPFSSCNFENNWMASTNENGGTPGTENSAYSLEPDTIEPNLTNVYVTSTTQLQAVFSEGMDLTSLINGNFSISNGITVDSVAIDSLNYYGVTVYVSAISSGVIYTLTIENVTDCPGNAIANKTVDFVLPEVAQAGDLILNEILFNPSTGGSDFVEVYNNSSRYIDLSDWSLSSYDLEMDTLDKVIQIGGNQHVLYPGEYALLTEDTAWTLEEYPLSNQDAFVTADIPSYNDDDGVVVLLTPGGEISDRFDYDEDMHFSLLVDEEGISLERLDFDRITNDYTNWHSAAENVGFATPGYENSQYQPAEEPNDVIAVEPEIFSPDQDGYNDVLNISYQLDEPGYVGTIWIYDAKGRLVRKLMNNELLSPEGTISWNGTNDINEKSRIGIYVIFFSAYSTDGKVIKEKTTCVLGSQL